jgi:DNA repair protein RecN (Recombination protein N)
MLRELHISNLAVIEDAHIEFGEGLNCFTGQTGAGKSLIIGAFEVLLGLRSAGDLLRDGADEGKVSGVFELYDHEMIEQINALADAGLDAEQTGEQLLITRKLFASGRTSVSVNGQPATIAMLQQIGELLVDVHGQHDHQYLLKPAHQLMMLDRFAETDNLRKEYAQLHRQLGDLRERRAALEASATLRRQQLELYEFQADEIDEAEPTEGEYEELAARHRVMSNLERITREAGAAHAALYESDGAVIERLQAITAVLKTLGELDEEIEPIAEDVKAALAQLQDAAFSINRYVNRLDLDAEELAEIEQRLNTLNRLIQKYGSAKGGTLDEVLGHRATIGQEIDRLRAESDDLESLDDQIAPLQAKLRDVGQSLSRKRKAAAKKLCPQVIEQLTELGMDKALFEVSFESAAEPGASATGIDDIELLVAPNPGQAPRPLRKIASGGELSRIMLALKSILAHCDRISVLVFDEIDANIGGRMGSVIGDKLRDLASHHQVLCITHLPQIAAYAEHHLRIAKRVAKGQTRTEVHVLVDDQRVDELADMLAGKKRTATTRKQAQEMLATVNGNGKTRSTRD